MPFEFYYDAANYTATWRFDSLADGDQYLLSLAETVTDADGIGLDGEWVNPATLSTVNSSVSIFPSGNGVAGGQFDFIATILAGDANLDGVVDDQDFEIFIDSYFSGLSNPQFTDGDFDGNGIVDDDDFDLMDGENWDMNLQSLWILADLDGNFFVDDEDLDMIDENIGMTGATRADGDLNGNGVVTLDDLDMAFAQYGLALVVVS